MPVSGERPFKPLLLPPALLPEGGNPTLDGGVVRTPATCSDGDAARSGVVACPILPSSGGVLPLALLAFSCGVRRHERVGPRKPPLPPVALLLLTLVGYSGAGERLVPLFVSSGDTLLRKWMSCETDAMLVEPAPDERAVSI